MPIIPRCENCGRRLSDRTAGAFGNAAGIVYYGPFCQEEKDD